MLGGAGEIMLPRIHAQRATFEAADRSELDEIVGGGGQAHPPPEVWNRATFVLVSLRSRPDIVAVMLKPTHSPLETGIRKFPFDNLPLLGFPTVFQPLERYPGHIDEKGV